MLIEELGKLLINPLAKTNFFFSNDSQELKKKAQRDPDYAWFWMKKNKIEEIFSIIYFIHIFIYIYIAVQRLIEELGKLLIDPL